MTDQTKTLEISSSDLSLIANALETQSKILRMQANGGGANATARLNEVKRLLATVSNKQENTPTRRVENSGFWRMMRSMRQAT